MGARICCLNAGFGSFGGQRPLELENGSENLKKNMLYGVEVSIG